MIRPSITKRSPFIVSAAICMLIVIQTVFGQIPSDPNGSRPTMLSNFRIARYSATHDVVTGTLTTVSGWPMISKQVDLYSVSSGQFVKISNGARTDQNGNFSIQIMKPRTTGGRQIQAVIPLGGSHSRPYPTLIQN